MISFIAISLLFNEHEVFTPLLSETRLGLVAAIVLRIVGRDVT